MSLVASVMLSPGDFRKLENVWIAVGGMAFCDLAILCHLKARWYWLHAFSNMVVVVYSWNDLVRTAQEPSQALSGEYSWIPAYVIPAIHIYHLVAFPCTPADWVHHVLFAGVICPLGLFISQTGPVQNAVSFFICGLPGGLDYFMLAFVKCGWMSRMNEKFMNARINVWIRSPGLLFCVFVMWVSFPNAAGNPPWWGVGTGALLCLLNGQYYMQVVVGNTFLRSRQEGDRVYNS